MVNKIHLICSPKVRDCIMIDCKREFLEHHPEFKGMRITQNFMLQKLVDFFLKEE